MQPQESNDLNCTQLQLRKSQLSIRVGTESSHPVVSFQSYHTTTCDNYGGQTKPHTTTCVAASFNLAQPCPFFWLVAAWVKSRAERPSVSVVNRQLHVQIGCKLGIRNRKDELEASKGTSIENAEALPEHLVRNYCGNSFHPDLISSALGNNIVLSEWVNGNEEGPRSLVAEQSAAFQVFSSLCDKVEAEAMRTTRKGKLTIDRTLPLP